MTLLLSTSDAGKKKNENAQDNRYLLDLVEVFKIEPEYNSKRHKIGQLGKQTEITGNSGTNELVSVQLYNWHSNEQGKKY